MGPYGEYAKKYRRLGWEGALPLPPKQKEEPPTGYTGHGAPYPKSMEVQRWMRQTFEKPGTPKWRGVDGNICLRLAGVDTNKLRNVPTVYAGNIVDGWELIGIDVDDYGDKHGFDQLLALEAELGPLPATVISSARWADSAKSGTRILLVPKGFKFKGKAAATEHEGPKHIDILYAGLRYLVVWPSVHPTGTTYEFRHGDSEGIAGDYAGEVPPLTELAVLPEAWFRHLLAGVGGDADAKSDMDFGELEDWAVKTFRDVEGEPCRDMAKDVDKYINNLDPSDHHHPLNDVVWRLTRNALEGHSGWHTAVMRYVEEWWEISKDVRDLEEMRGEIARTIQGALAKVKAEWDKRDGYMAEDKCEPGAGDVDDWAKRWEERTARVEAADHGGFGPVVGRMEFGDAKPADEYGQHDDGNAQHFIDVVGANAKYVDGRDSWVVWDGERWHRDLNGRYVRLAYRRVRMNQEKFAKQLASEARQNDDKSMARKANSWALFAKQSGNLPPIKRALESAEALNVGGDPVAIHANTFDSNPGLLGCANGTLELTENPDVREPRKEDYVTFNTNVEYVPWRALANAEGDTLEGYALWTEYLETFLPDEDVRRYVQKVLGHMIVGENPEKRIVFLYGPHDTGKSTMLGALQGAMGDYFGTVDVSLFKQKDLNPGLIRAVPLRITAMSEVDAGTMDVSMVKKLTGNDTVMAEAKYSNEIFQGRPQFTTVVACNNPPYIAHADEALEERLLVLPFVTTITRRNRRYERQTQIERHSGVAVLSWLVEGWKMYCAEGLGSQPKAVRGVQRDMMSGLNATQTFITECLERATDCEEGRRALQAAKALANSKGYPKPKVQHLPKEWTAPAGMVYELYCRWCSANGVQAGSHPELTKDIGVNRPDVRKLDGKPTRCYYGLRIKADVEQRGTGWRVK